MDLLIGDYSKAKKKVGWEPKTRFEEVINLMVDEDVRRLKEHPEVRAKLVGCPVGLNDRVERLGWCALLFFHLFTQQRDCQIVGDFHNRIAHFLRHPAEGAFVLARACALLGAAFAHATDGCERAFDGSDDSDDRDIFWPLLRR